jgi:hypothetical protein
MLSETDWVLSTDDALGDEVAALGPRRTRLLAAALCRDLLPNLWSDDWETASAALDAVEVFADTGKTKVALRRARQAVRAARAKIDAGQGYEHWLKRSGRGILWAVEVAASENAVVFAVRAVYDAVNALEDLREETIRRRLYGPYRDIAGLPHGLVFDPAWRTSTVLALAERMYESRDFGAMPILADALQDAGCDNDSVLSHCRGPSEPNDGHPPNIPTAPFVHVRGCWVVDRVLGRV